MQRSVITHSSRISILFNVRNRSTKLEDCSKNFGNTRDFTTVGECGSRWHWRRLQKGNSLSFPPTPTPTPTTTGYPIFSSPLKSSLSPVLSLSSFDLSHTLHILSGTRPSLNKRQDQQQQQPTPITSISETTFASLSSSSKSSTSKQFTSSSSSFSSESSAVDSPKSTSSNKKKRTQTYYDLFPETLPLGPPPSGPFDIPTQSLRQEFIKLQQSHHPDMMIGQSSSSSFSALLNNAYKTLLDPYKRAEYILCEVIPFMDRDGTSTIATTDDILSESTTLINDPFLFEIMNILEDIQENPHLSSKDLEHLKLEHERTVDTEVKDLGRLLEKARWNEAKEALVRLRYSRRILDAIEKRMEEGWSGAKSGGGGWAG